MVIEIKQLIKYKRMQQTGKKELQEWEWLNGKSDTHRIGTKLKFEYNDKYHMQKL